MPFFLLFLFGLAIAVGTAVTFLLIRRSRQATTSLTTVEGVAEIPTEPMVVLRRPDCWLAIKGKSVCAVQRALGINNPKPCSWTRGLTGEEKLFIAPPISGWILVIGSGLPDPCADPDVSFRFISHLSRKLGHVQFFSASRILHYHAWVQAENGRVTRAYAWAGQTLWHQGKPTAAEQDLDLHCLEYDQGAEAQVAIGLPEQLMLNAEKVPLLAARWSLDPARIEERLLINIPGIAGEPSLRY